LKIKISDDEIYRLLEIEPPEFDKYFSPLINLANRYAQGTRPKVVGQMTELIHQFTGKTWPEWEKWYTELKPVAIKTATQKILVMLENLKMAIERIDEKAVERWVRDLVIAKTFTGLKFQEAILKKGAELCNSDYRFSSPAEEKKGIDGFLGKIPVSIKPNTYQLKPELPEHIDIKMILYEKTKSGLEVDFGDIL
jgi:hypothetical protein